jgi:hypothetical protein
MEQIGELYYYGGTGAFVSSLAGTGTITHDNSGDSSISSSLPTSADSSPLVSSTSSECSSSIQLSPLITASRQYTMLMPKQQQQQYQQQQQTHFVKVSYLSRYIGDLLILWCFISNDFIAYCNRPIFSIIRAPSNFRIG